MTILNSTTAIVTAAGTSQGAATVLAASFNIITSATALSGVAVSNNIGMPQRVYNVTTVNVYVYPPSSAAIGSLRANVPVLLVPGGSLELCLTSSTQVYVFAANPSLATVDPFWTQKYKNNTDIVARAQPSVPTKPSYLGSYIDPYYGTKIVRITDDPGNTILNVSGGIWGMVATHHYSNDCPWNADESLLRLAFNHDPTPVNVTLATTAASSTTTLTFSTTVNKGIYPNNIVTGTGVPASTHVVSVASTTVVVNNAVSVASGASITFADGGTPTTDIFLDGQTYVPLFQATAPGDVRWHPTDPTKMIYVQGTTIGYWTPSTNTTATLYTLTGYTSASIGSYNGNATFAASPIIPIIATRTSDSKIVGFTYDVSLGTKSPDCVAPLSTQNYAALFLSLDGTYLVGIDQNDATDIFTRSTGAHYLGTYAAPAAPSHMDITVDTNGDQIVMGVDKNNGRVCKRRLSDGTVTDLTVSSPANFATHTSCRSMMYPGYAFVSFYSLTEATSYPLYAGEIVAVKSDASVVYRLCHHFNVNSPNDYYDEVHGSVSPSGTRVIYSSNWGNPNGNTRPVQCYVCDMRS